jgi:hypothetical protein
MQSCPTGARRERKEEMANMALCDLCHKQYPSEALAEGKCASCLLEFLAYAEDVIQAARDIDSAYREREGKSALAHMIDIADLAALNKALRLYGLYYRCITREGWEAGRIAGKPKVTDSWILYKRRSMPGSSGTGSS